MNTATRMPKGLAQDIAATAGVANFGQYLRLALYQCRFAIVGGWEDSELSMSDEFVTDAFKWLMGGHVTDELKAEFIFDALLQEGSTKRAAMMFLALKSGDWIPLMQLHVETLIKDGGHWQSLCEFALGPDRRQTINDEINESYKVQR